MTRFFGDEWEQTRQKISGFWFDDEQTKTAMRDVFARKNYLMCPHTAVAYLALTNKETAGIFMSTAHYAKFLNVVEEALGTNEVAIPKRLSDLLSKPKVALPISKRFEDFKSYLMS
jgi:threonine synthase